MKKDTALAVIQTLLIMAMLILAETSNYAWLFVAGVLLIFSELINLS